MLTDAGMVEILVKLPELDMERLLVTFDTLLGSAISDHVRKHGPEFNLENIPLSLTILGNLHTVVYAAASPELKAKEKRPAQKNSAKKPKPAQ